MVGFAGHMCWKFPKLKSAWKFWLAVYFDASVACWCVNATVGHRRSTALD